MRKLFAFTALLSSGACLGQSSPARDLDTPAVTIYTHFQEQPAPTVIRHLQAELASILRPVGVQFEWRSLDDPRASEPVAELVVVKFKGRCSAAVSLPAARIASGALGWTHVSDGDLLPFSDIDCDRIWRFIHPEMGAYETSEHDRSFGRALGRVLAHELYHIFANTTKHARAGIAKSCYTAPELLSEEFHLTEREFKLIRTGKLRNLFRQSTPPMVLDAGGGE
jgi:hypothetical protein